MALDRITKRVQNILGVIRPGDSPEPFKQFRSDKLKKYETYMNGEQYDNLTDWHMAIESSTFIPVNKRKPIIIYPLPRIVVNRIKAKIVGEKVFPNLKLEDDPATQELLREVLKITDFKLNMAKAVEDLLTYGSSFMRIKIIEGSMFLESFNPNYCYPVFDDRDRLVKVEVRFVFEKLVKGEKKKLWYKLLLTKDSDILYDNPEYEEGVVPAFQVVQRVNHNLDFVQGEWVKATKDFRMVDGPSLLEDILDFSDCLNYLFTMSDSATKYNIDPQVIFSGVDAENLQDLVKAKEKAWALGHDGSANFLEVSGTGVSTAVDVSKETIQRVQDATRVILHDPERYSAPCAKWSGDGSFKRTHG